MIVILDREEFWCPVGELWLSSSAESPFLVRRRVWRLRAVFRKMCNPPSSVDLEVRVTTPWGRGGRSLEFVLSSPSGAVDFYQVAISGKEIHSPESFQRKLFQQLEDLHRGCDADGKGVVRREVFGELTAIGRDLYQELFPREMRNVYRELHGRVKSLLVTSDEPWIPWEILRPFEHDDDDFLCMRFQMSRWLTGETLLVAEKRIARIACLIGTDVALTSTDDELSRLKKLANKTPDVEFLSLPDTTSQDVTELLEERSFDLLHFAGHGEYDEARPGEAKILLGDRAFRARHLSPVAERNLRDERPVVFFNACQVGRLDRALADLDGWAPRWVRRCGCSAFLAPFWSVNDERACRFAEVFYEELLEGRTLGEAVLVARHKLRDEDRDEMAWLAYSLYGHPGARITFGDYRPPVGREKTVTPPPSPLVSTVSRPPSALGAGRAPVSRRRSLPKAARHRGVLVASVVLFSALTVYLAVAGWRDLQTESAEIPPISAPVKPATPSGTPPPLTSTSATNRQGEEEASRAEDLKTPPTLPIVAGRVGIVVLDSTTRLPDVQLADAVERVLASEYGLDVTTLPADAFDVEGVLGGDISGLGVDGRSPHGAERLLVVGATRSSPQQDGSPFERVVLTMDVHLVEIRVPSLRRSNLGPHAGIGPSTDAALVQATERCLKPMIHELKEGVDDDIVR